jgi:hypothetical protein
VTFKDNLKRGKGEYSALINGKLFPNTTCSWGKCSFCGINQKYLCESRPCEESLTEKIEIIRELVADGVQWWWFRDEAVPENLLRSFAQAVIDSKIKFIWHIRSRLDGGFNKELCELLYRSGLREIRFGLETAASEIQKLINKFEHFDLDEIEGIVERFCDSGIKVHFPCIIGFPNESVEQRQETYTFLRKLRTKFDLFSYNINSLQLDVASEFYKHPKKFGIINIELPCEEELFIGNFAKSWQYENSDFDVSELVKEQEAVMRELYPFVPEMSFTPVRAYYRLAENMRLTLRWVAPTV